MKRHTVNHLVYYTSDLLDKNNIKHGFFTRLGGVSPAPFDSLNMKRDLADEVKNVLKNRRLVCQTLKLDSEKLVFAHLGHKDKVHIASVVDTGKELKGYDALITKEPNLPIMLSVADCLPIIIADRHNTAVAITHVSWKSLAAGIIDNTIAVLKKRLNLQPDGLLAAFGPAIHVNSYEVGSEFIGYVSQRFEKFLVQRQAKTYFDIPAAANHELRTLGVRQIDDLDMDTFSNTNEFYSYRAEGQTGRFAAVISL